MNGKKLKKLILAKYPIQKFAFMVGVTPQTIYNIVNGDQVPSVTLVKRMSEILGENLIDLF